MKFKSTGLSLFLAFLLHNMIWICAGAVIVSNNIASFSKAFFALFGCPIPIFLSLCIINMKAYIRKYDVSQREKRFYTLTVKVMSVIVVLCILLTIACVLGASR